MIQVVGLRTRRSEITDEQFVEHWLEIHGPLARSCARRASLCAIPIRYRDTLPGLDIPETDVEVDGIAGNSGIKTIRERLCAGCRDTGI